MKGSTLRDSFVLIIIVLVVLAAIFVGEIGIVTPNDTSNNSSTIVQCTGTFSPKLEIRLKEKRRYPPPETNVLEQCTYLEITIEDVTVFNWTETRNMQIRLPHLNFFVLHLLIPLEKKLIRETELIRRIGWRNLLFLDNFKRTDIWANKIGFKIMLKDSVLLSYEPHLNENSVGLTIGSLDHANDVVSDFSLSTVQMPLKYLRLSNCKIKNLPHTLAKRLFWLELINVDYTGTDDFVRKCESLEKLTLESKLGFKTFDLTNLQILKQLVNVKFGNINLVLNQKLPAEFKKESLTHALFNGCNFDKSIKDNNGWQIFSNLQHLQLSDLPEPFDLADLLPCKGLKTVYVEHSTLLINTDNKYGYQNVSLPLLQNLFVKDCYWDASLVHNFWKIAPNLKSLAIVSDSGPNSALMKPNSALLDMALSNLERITWIHFTNFEWNTSNAQVQKKMSNFLHLTKGDLRGNEENFIILRSEQENWHGWKYRSNEEYNEQILEYLLRSDRPPEKYVMEKLAFSLSKGETRDSYYLEKLIAKLDEGIVGNIVFNNRLLPVNESWITGRNLSIIAEGRILVKMAYRESGDAEVTISHLPTKANRILKIIREESRNLTKLALSNVTIENFNLLQCDHLKELSLFNVNFAEADITYKVLKECGELTELIMLLSYNTNIDVDLRSGIKSKKLKKLVLGGWNITLASDKSQYETLEDLFLDRVHLHSSFHENFWKFYPNLKRIGIGKVDSGEPNPSFLKSIIEKLKYIELIYFKNFNWKQTDAPINSEVVLEMEEFVFGTRGKLFGNETHFVLKKLPGDIWAGQEFGKMVFKHPFLEFQEHE